MTDYYKCENCGKIFDEFEMNYRLAQIDKKCWCRECREAQCPNCGQISASSSTCTNCGVLDIPKKE